MPAVKDGDVKHEADSESLYGVKKTSGVEYLEYKTWLKNTSGLNPLTFSCK